MLPVNARNNSADMVVNDGFKWRTGAMAMTRSIKNGSLFFPVTCHHFISSIPELERLYSIVRHGEVTDDRVDNARVDKG
jgi:hypothetical protein